MEHFVLLQILHMTGVRRIGKHCFKPDAYSFEEIPLFCTVKQESCLLYTSRCV